MKMIQNTKLTDKQKLRPLESIPVFSKIFDILK